jgi:hypothetical protein
VDRQFRPVGTPDFPLYVKNDHIALIARLDNHRPYLSLYLLSKAGRVVNFSAG